MAHVVSESPLENAQAGICRLGADGAVLECDATAATLGAEIGFSLPSVDEVAVQYFELGGNRFATLSPKTREFHALQRSEDRFKAAIEGSLDAFFILEAVRDEEGEITDFRFVDFNARGEQLIGFTREEAVGQCLCELLPLNRSQGFFEKYKRVVESGEPIEEEFGNCAGGHDDIWIHQQVTKVGDGIAISTHDATHRKQQELALNRSQARLDLVQEAPQLGIWFCDLPFDKLRWNANVKRHFGLPVDHDVSIDDFYKWLHPDDREMTRVAIERSISTGETMNVLYRTMGPDGILRWIRAIGRPGYENGLPARFDGITIDETPHKLLQEELTEQRHALEIVNRTGARLAAELNLEPLVQVLTDACTELCGAQFGSFFYNAFDAHGESYMLFSLSGVPRSAFEGFPMPRNTAIFGPTFAGEGVVRIDDVTKDPRYGQNEPYRGMPKGHLPVRSYLALPVKSKTGEVIGGLFFGHELPGVFTRKHEEMLVGVAAQAAVALDNAQLYGQLQKLKAELESRVEERTAELTAANAEMEGFTYSVSHDLRAPLRAIMSSSMILLEDFGDTVPDGAREQLERQARAAKRLANLIDDLLKLSRLGRQEMIKIPVDLSLMGRDIAEELAERCSDATIHIAEGLLAQGDPRLLKLMLTNLLENACKFAKPGRSAIVRFGQDEQGFFVADEGIGFAHEYAEKIFRPFERLHRDDVPGTGIGLANVRRVVERHGGHVWATGEEGKGATFRFTL